MKVGRTLYVHRAADWRSWLRKHQAKAREIWLIYYKKDSGRPRLSYNDAVDQALCFGWIDSTVKTLDRHRFCQRFSPRRKGSPCSEMNKARAKRMVRLGQMTPAGLSALQGTLGYGAKVAGGRIREAGNWKVPADIEKALRKAPGAWKHFRKFPLTYQRIRTAFVEGARKRPGMFRRRLNYLVKMSALGKRFGMVRE